MEKEGRRRLEGEGRVKEEECEMSCPSPLHPITMYGLTWGEGPSPWVLGQVHAEAVSVGTGC